MSDHSVSDLAKILKRSRSSITSLITSGRLKAYDAAPEGRRRQYRVTAQALEEFRQSNRPVKKKVRRTVRRPERQYI